MTHSFAMVFPGQGSQTIGMLGALAEKFPEVEVTFAEASDAFGHDLWDLVQQGPVETLNQTAYTQPAMLAADIAVWRCWQSSGGAVPCAVAGHSLGEYAALVCAQVLAFEDAVRLVADRGRFMQDAVAPGIGAMAAVIGLDDAGVQALCEQASSVGMVSAANFNSVGQVVVAGEVAAVDEVVAKAKPAGARIAKKIPVSVPSHCALMQPAADRLAEQLSQVVFHAPRIPVFHNVDAKTHQDPTVIRDLLVQQLVGPVRWVATIESMITNGIATYLECGPGRVLTGLNKRISKSIVVEPLSGDDEISKAIQMISKVS